MRSPCATAMIGTRFALRARKLRVRGCSSISAGTAWRYFCDPSELATILNMADPTNYQRQIAGSQASIAAPLANWVDHWSM